MAFDLAKVQVAPLNGLHQLDRFCCAYAPAQAFCRGRLAETHDSFAIRAFVATHDGDPRIVGYYYLCLSTVSHDAVPREREGLFLRLDAIPTVYLGMLAVDRRLARCGIGKRLMADALARVGVIARNAGTYALTLDAIDADTAEFYAKNFMFQRFSPDGLKMFLEVPTILALGLEEPAQA